MPRAGARPDTKETLAAGEEQASIRGEGKVPLGVQAKETKNEMFLRKFGGLTLTNDAHSWEGVKPPGACRAQGLVSGSPSGVCKHGSGGNGEADTKSMGSEP